MNLAETIEAKVRTLVGATHCNVSYVLTDLKELRQKSPTDKSMINPYWSQIKAQEVRKVVDNAHINLGVIYENAINKKLDKKELDADFEAEAMRGKIPHINHHKCLCQNLDRTKTYISYQPKLSDNMIVKYMLGDKDITAELKPFKAIHKEIATQANAGLTGKEQIDWRTLTIANITSLIIMKETITGKIEQERETTEATATETATV